MRQLLDFGLFTGGFGINAPSLVLLVWFVFFVVLDNCAVCWDYNGREG